MVSPPRCWSFSPQAHGPFGTFIQAANSIEKLEDGLYSMDYSGDYGFDNFLARGGAASDSEAANYLLTFFPAAFTKSKAMCSRGEFGCSNI